VNHPEATLEVKNHYNLSQQDLTIQKHTFNHQFNMHFKYHSESTQNKLGQCIMGMSTNSLPTPIPQERHVDAFKHILEKVFGHGEYRKLTNCSES
jgi:hypothetical protein